jgi:diguanylate cyclase (GGDEF)-like protein
VNRDPVVVSQIAELASKDFDVHTAISAEGARDLLGSNSIDLILVDQHLSEMTGIRLLEWVREHSPKTLRLATAGLDDWDGSAGALHSGLVHRYLLKPWRSEELLEVLRHAARMSALQQDNELLMAELRALNPNLNERVRQRTEELEVANHELRQQNLALQKLALTDALTGLPNRRAMDRLARSELKRRARYPSPLALGLIDVDNFKDVNSRHLLPGGDQVLIGLSKTLTEAMRTVDCVGRIGGEEFMVVAPETDLEGAAVLAERIRAAVEHSRFDYKGASIQVTVSIGFAVALVAGLVAYEQMKHAAAAALEEAKSGGRNRCLVRPIAPPSGNEG